MARGAAQSSIPNPQSPAPWPPITCLCPTYGRFERLRLALACFLAQTYPGEARLLILNDAPVRIPTADLPDRVSVINVLGTEPFASLGIKRQALLNVASTPLVAHWDDDDLYLPHHLERSVAALLAAECGCVKSRGGWYVKGSVPRLDVRGVHHNTFEGTMVFRRVDARVHGGYPATHSGQAAALLRRFGEAGQLVQIADDEGADLNPLGTGGVSYVYRWADGAGHISAIGNRPDSAAKFTAQNTDFGDARTPLTPGDLAPYWQALGLPSGAEGAHKSYPSHTSYASFPSHAVEGRQ